MTTTTSTLLADPAQVAAVRRLITLARTVGAEHATYSFGNGLGQPMAPVEHTWTLGDLRVTYQIGHLLIIKSHATVLHAREVESVRQATQLLAAMGVLSVEFAASATPDRRCRHCGATSGLKPLHTSPLTLAAKEWQCWDGCRDSAR